VNIYDIKYLTTSIKYSTRLGLYRRPIGHWARMWKSAFRPRSIRPDVNLCECISYIRHYRPRLF